jgi:hypothetical protein
VARPSEDTPGRLPTPALKEAIPPYPLGTAEVDALVSPTADHLDVSVACRKGGTVGQPGMGYTAWEAWEPQLGNILGQGNQPGSERTLEEERLCKTLAVCEGVQVELLVRQATEEKGHIGKQSPGW